MSLSKPRSSGRRLVPACIASLALTLAAVGAMAGPARAVCASPCHWFSGELAKNWAYASIEAHSLTYIQGNANHNEFCIGAEAGSAGSYKDTSASDCQVYSGGTFAAAGFYGGSCCFHATIVNVGPLSSINVTSATHYNY